MTFKSSSATAICLSRLSCSTPAQFRQNVRYKIEVKRINGFISINLPGKSEINLSP